jgi:O-antigen/teichoic acid export membrane protein
MLGAHFDQLLLLLLAANVLSLLPFVRPARRLLGGTTKTRTWPAVWRAAPFGLMVLATIVFYRAGTLVLALLSNPHETAVFTVASNVGFGLLALPNAITTGLLPRLSATSSPRQKAAAVRWAVIWTLILTVPLVVAADVLCPLLLPLALGKVYAAAAPPLGVLTVSVLLISISGIAGTVLIVAGRTRALALQVAVSLAVNLLALVLLTPGLGALGAALATLLCEGVGLALLIPATLRALPELRQITWRRRGLHHGAGREPAGALIR